GRIAKCNKAYEIRRIAKGPMITNEILTANKLHKIMVISMPLSLLDDRCPSAVSNHGWRGNEAGNDSSNKSPENVKDHNVLVHDEGQLDYTSSDSRLNSTNLRRNRTSSPIPSPKEFGLVLWEHGGNTLDRSKGNKRNWILVWEDGFCDFQDSHQGHKIGPDVFFKMTHEVYRYGEGIIGKVAADNSHKWVFRENGGDNDSSIISSWNVFIDPQPKTWQSQFNSGVQTIALISVREGVIQLGSLNKVEEDLNLVINIQRKFSSLLQSVPGVLSTIQRPLSSMNQSPTNHISQYHFSNETTSTSNSSFFNEGLKPQFSGLKRSLYSQGGLNEVPTKSARMGWNGPHQRDGIPLPPPRQPPPSSWSPPPPFPNLSYCNFGAFLSKTPSQSASPSSPTTTSNCTGGGSSSLLDSDIIRPELTRPDPCGTRSSVNSAPTARLNGNADKVDSISYVRDDKTNPVWFVGVRGMRMVHTDNSINAQM
ncbi:RICE SALT SENSITIVE 3-like protein, partial [Drosera capensis]